MPHFPDLKQHKAITKNHSILHTMCTLGNSEVHTFKLILCCSSVEECSSIRMIQWAPSDTTKLVMGYTKQCNHDRSDWKVKFYLRYRYPFKAIQVTTNYSHQLNNKLSPIKPDTSYIREWCHFADIDLKRTNFASVNIRIDIELIEKETDKTLPDLSSLLVDPIYSDATIESCDGVALKIHRCILATRSDVFKTLFIDSSSSTIRSKFEAVVLKELLNFIYCGIKPVKLDSVADRLLAAAQFYKVNDLKSFCEYALYKQLTVDNVIDILMFADLHAAVDLKILAMDFLDCNTSVVFTKSAWANLNSLDLVKAVYENTKATLDLMTEAENVKY